MRFREISIIICCYNSRKKIVPTLKHLSKQILSDVVSFEIILVNNNCSDDTVEVALETWKQIGNSMPLRIIEETSPGKANALATGFNAASYELMLICDDDNWLRPFYLHRVFEIYNRNPLIGLLGGYGSQPWFGSCNEEKSLLFEANKKLFVIGNHIGSSGFLSEGQFNIWGAGSVLRKEMWNYLVKSNFEFRTSINKSKAQAEDIELAFAISLTGSQLYFDSELTFIHDLSGSRISKKSIANQVKINARNLCWIFHYKVILKQIQYSKEKLYSFFYFRELAKLFYSGFIKSIAQMKEGSLSNSSFQIYLFLLFWVTQIKTLFFGYWNFKKKVIRDYDFLRKIYRSFPLS